METFIMENMGAKWRERRGRILKNTGCDASQGLDHSLSLRPHGRDERDWDMFCRYSKHVQGTKITEQNKTSIIRRDQGHSTRSVK
ncbi:hypothetical protein LINPERPRIM_LOCUS30385 [Linum perenne]